MLQAKPRIENKLSEIDRQLGSLEAEKHQLIQRRDKQLRIILEKHLILKYIPQLSGIGEALGTQIIQLYKESLEDLKYAWKIRGIGDWKYRSICNLVNVLKENLPALLEEQFPGKEAVLDEYKDRILGIEDRFDDIQSKKSDIQAQLSLMSEAINKMECVTPNDFINVRLNGSVRADSVEMYQKGVFSEWECIPDWFKIVMKEAGHA